MGRPGRVESIHHESFLVERTKLWGWRRDAEREVDIGNTPRYQPTRPAREHTLSPMCSWAPWWDESWRWALVRARIWSPRHTRDHCGRQEAFERPGSSDEVHPHNITRGMLTYRNTKCDSHISFFSFQIQVVLCVSQMPSKENTFWIWCDDPCLMLAAQDHNNNVNREQVGELSSLLSFLSTVCHLILYIKLFQCFCLLTGCFSSWGECWWNPSPQEFLSKTSGCWEELWI